MCRYILDLPIRFSADWNPQVSKLIDRLLVKDMKSISRGKYMLLPLKGLHVALLIIHKST